MKSTFAHRCLLISLVVVAGCRGPDEERTWRQSYDDLARHPPSSMELELIRRTKLPFAPSARLLYHLIWAQEGAERWLIFCPAGTHPVTAHVITSLDPKAHVYFTPSSNPNAHLAYIASQLGTKDVGKLTPGAGGPTSCTWNSKGQWDAEITSVDRGDYVQIHHAWKEVRVAGRWVNSEDVTDICP